MDRDWKGGDDRRRGAVGGHEHEVWWGTNFEAKMKEVPIAKYI